MRRVLIREWVLFLLVVLVKRLIQFFIKNFSYDRKIDAPFFFFCFRRIGIALAVPIPKTRF